MQPCLPIYFLILLFTLAGLGFYIATLRQLSALIEKDREIQKAQRKIDEQLAAQDRIT